LKDPEKLNKFISGIMDPFKDKEDDDLIRLKQEEKRIIENEKMMLRRAEQKRKEAKRHQKEQRRKDMETRNIVCWPFCYSVPNQEKEDRKQYEEWKLNKTQSGEQNDHLREEIEAAYREEIMSLRSALLQQQEQYPSYLNSSYTSPSTPGHKYIDIEEDDNKNRKKREDDSDSNEEASVTASEEANKENKENEDKIQLTINEKNTDSDDKEESYHESVDNLPV
jgi:hypothetical protein